MVAPPSDVVAPEKRVVLVAADVLEMRLAALLGVADVLSEVDVAPEIVVAVGAAGLDKPTIVIGTDVVAADDGDNPEACVLAVKGVFIPESTANSTSSNGIGIPDLVGAATTITVTLALPIALPTRPVMSIEVRPSFIPEPTRTVTVVDPPTTGFDFVDKEIPGRIDFTDNRNAPVNPVLRRIVKTKARADPRPTVIVPGRTDSENFAAEGVTGILLGAAAASPVVQSTSTNAPNRAVLSAKAPLDNGLDPPLASESSPILNTRTGAEEKGIYGI